MTSPFFPVEFSNISKNFHFHCVQEGEEFSISNYKINTKNMFHPNGCVAYSVESPNGKKIIYATDSELKSSDFEQTEKNKTFFSNVDVLIMDSQYTVEEASGKENWGHSTFCYAIDFASNWSVKKIYLFHHEPKFDDKKIYTVLDSARWYANSVKNKIQVELAVEGLEEEF
jgi:phosphoribosyl 1,2-cyclic phosphodiesterase